MTYALTAGGAIGLAAGMVGWFLVLRAQVFTGDALSHVAVAGALGALAFGVDLRLGLYAACVLFALATAGLGGSQPADDTTIGIGFAWVLGLGALFLSIYTTGRSGAGAISGVNVLFGTILGLSRAQAEADVALAGAVVILLVAIGRPLVFASLDGDVAAARGVPVRRLGFFFLGLVGVTAGEATQAVGGLLLLGLLAAPAGAAHRLTTRPFAGIWLAGAIGAGSVLGGLAIANAAPGIPPSTAILGLATSTYLLALAATARPGSGAVARAAEPIR